MREIEEDMDDDFIDEEPIPAKRDVRIFQRKKEKTEDDDEFEEDVFV
ncbi:MAG: hypothetical protein QXK76_02400 [Candidatus Woesearchaeota archaeon]